MPMPGSESFLACVTSQIKEKKTEQVRVWKIEGSEFCCRRLELFRKLNVK